MFYEFAITTPKNTAEASPLRTTVTLDVGVVRYVEVQFPAGCVGLVHAKILDALHQVWPSNNDGNIASDNARIGWREDQEITNAEKEFVIVTWNDDDSYPHTLTFRFEVVPLELLQRQRRAAAALDYLASWFEQAPIVSAEDIQPL
jgi:hypothetical protein